MNRMGLSDLWMIWLGWSASCKTPPETSGQVYIEQGLIEDLIERNMVNSTRTMRSTTSLHQNGAQTRHYDKVFKNQESNVMSVSFAQRKPTFVSSIILRYSKQLILGRGLPQVELLQDLADDIN